MIKWLKKVMMMDFKFKVDFGSPGGDGDEDDDKDD